MGNYLYGAAAVEAMAETMEECGAVSKDGPAGAPLPTIYRLWDWPPEVGQLV